ncbi:MAG: hypothetical protein ACHQ3O_01440 [Candidatus Limnocylindria bacterium]
MDRKTARTQLHTLPPSVPSPFGFRYRNPTSNKGLHNPMQTKYSAMAFALALGVLTYAPGAGAIIRPSQTDAESCFAIPQICLTAANANPTWGDDPGEEEVILDKPLIITDGGVLTILPGVTVRGNPRSAAVVTNEVGGSPGTIIVTQSGKIDWQGEGTPTGVIIMTTAALDNNGDRQPDDFDGNSFEDPYPGYNPALSGAVPGVLPCTCGNNGTPLVAVDDCVGTDLILGTGDDSLGNCVVDATPAFHDDDPRGAPLAPLTPHVAVDPGLGPDGINGTADDVGGVGNVALWGGVVINGNAPTNTGGTSTAAAADAGNDLVEGLVVPGFPESVATYGGVEPHDSSGIVRFVSVRHAGDEIGTSNELNGFTLAGVGDGTVFDHNEVYCNFDDGFEWFGGTVNTSYLMVSHVGDDSFDFDQGYAGITQFGVSISGNYNQHNCNSSACDVPLAGAGLYGSESGDQIAEADGDDCAGDCNLGSGRDSISSLVAAVPNGLRAPTPVAASFQYNLTAVGNAEIGFVADFLPNAVCTAANTPLDCCTGVGAGFCENSSNSGYEMRNGFAGELRNSIIVNTGTGFGIDLAAGGAAGWTTPNNACADYDDIAAANGDADNGDLVRVVATTFDDVAEIPGSWPQPNVAFTPGAPTIVGSGIGPPAAGACVGDETQALENGDAIIGSGPFSGGNLVNWGPFAGLANEDVTFDPSGNALGQLDPTLKSAPSDLRPASSTGAVAGISPGGHPVAARDVTYRGAFESGGDVWTDGWTALSLGGLN